MVPSDLQLIKPGYVWTSDPLSNKERGHHKEKGRTASWIHLPPEAYFNEHALASQGNPCSHFALSKNTWDSSALPCVENSPKIGLLRLPRWIASLGESPLKPKALCFVIFVCIIRMRSFSKANHNYL